MDDVLSPLTRFRTALYHHVFGARRDALMELLDALLTAAAPPTSTVRLSLAAAFRRQWPSVFDARAEGTLDVAAWRRLVGPLVPPPPAEDRLLWALDGSTWPRP